MFIMESLPQAAPGESLCLLSKGKVFRCSTEVGKRGHSANRFLIRFKAPVGRAGPGAAPTHTPNPPSRRVWGLQNLELHECKWAGMAPTTDLKAGAAPFEENLVFAGVI